MRPRAYTLLALRLAAAEAGAVVGRGYCAPLAALSAPCPPLPMAEGIGSDVVALARAMGRDAEEVEAGVFKAAALAFEKAIKVAREVLLIAARSEIDPNNGEHRSMTYHPGVLPWRDVVAGYGVGCSFADVRLGRAWPEESYPTACPHAEHG